MNRFLRLMLLLLAAGLAIAPRAAVSQSEPLTVPAYTFVDLGTLRGKGTFATGINGSGQVSGYGYYEPASTDGRSNMRAFRITPVDTGSGLSWVQTGADGFNSRMEVYSLPSTTYRYSEAHGINAHGAVAGQVLGDGYTVPQNAFYGAPDLTGVRVTNDSSWAWGVNDQGTVVGEIFPRKGGGSVPTIWRLANGSFSATDLGIVSNSHARGINNLDQVVGSDGNIGVAYLWLPSPDYGLPAGKTSLGTFGGSVSYAYAINDQGHVVGYARDAAGSNLPYLWTPPTDQSGFGNPGFLLNILSGEWTGAHPRALTTPAAGDPLRIVGYAATPLRQGRAFVWDSTGREMRDLNLLVVNPPAAGLFEARGINAGGLIVGTFTFVAADGTRPTRPFLLLPNATLPNAASAPAPADAPVGQALSATQIQLDWTDVATDENGYRINRSTDGTSWIQVAALPADTTTFTDPWVLQGMRYHYQISSFNVRGYAAPAGVTVVTPGVPLAPTSCTASALSGSSVRVRWTNNSNTQTAFRVEYSTSSDFAGAATVTAATATATQLDVTGLTRNTTYYFRVQAENPVGVSAYSNTATATTPRK